jgi:hypothetical protein
MGLLSEALVPFLWLLARWRGEYSNLGSHLMFPAGSSGTLRGSDFGRSLWETAEAVSLLDFIEADAEFVAAFGRSGWNRRDEARRTVASACGQWAERPVRPETFAEQIESALWSSLRRAEITYSGATIIEGVSVSSPGMPFGYSRMVAPPIEPFMGVAFARAWPDYSHRLPSGPYALVIASVSTERWRFGGGTGLTLPRIVVNNVREAIWLVTGHLAPIGMGVTWEDHAVPIVGEPQRFEEEISIRRPDAPVSLDGLEPEISAMAKRLGVVDGNDPSPPMLDRSTADTLQLLRSQVDAAIRAPTAEMSLLQAYAAIEGSLRDASENVDLARGRCGYLCGRSVQERRALRKTASHLGPIRDAVAHGDRPTMREMARFIGQDIAGDAPADSPWLPGMFDTTPDLARQRGLDLLRRLYRAWLVATLDPTGASRMSREQLLNLIDQVRRVKGEDYDEAASRLLMGMNTTP